MAATLSQFPGFAEHFATYPRPATLPSAADQALLARHRPRVFQPPGHVGPVSFYDDYIAQGRLTGGDGRAISHAVTPAVLNAHKDDPHATFVHVPRPGQTTPVVLGRIAHDVIAFPDNPGGGARHRFTFLSYNIVFRHSGLPASYCQKLCMGLSCGGAILAFSIHEFDASNDLGELI